MKGGLKQSSFPTPKITEAFVKKCNTRVLGMSLPLELHQNPSQNPKVFKFFKIFFLGGGGGRHVPRPQTTLHTACPQTQNPRLNPECSLQHLNYLLASYN